MSGDNDFEILDLVELRVLAVLAEKEALTPDIYPLSLNALVNGCNQLSSRDPVMTLAEAEVESALQHLIARKLAGEVRQAGARVVKYEHRMRIAWSLEPSKLAVLVLLMLRGPQTAGEIRARSERLQRFASVDEVESCLQFLMDKFPPFVTTLARMRGTKEVRYMHLLGGAPAETEAEEASSADGAGLGRTPRSDRIAALEGEVAQLREEVRALTQQFAEFKQQFE